MGRLVLMVLVEGCVCAGCAPLSLQGAQMPGSHWGTRLVTPPFPVLPAHIPVSLPYPLWVSLLFQLTLHWCVGREHLIFIIWFREGPEALSHCMVSMETDLFRGPGVVTVGRGKHIVKIGLHKCGRSWTNSLQGGQEEAGQGSGGPIGGAAFPPPTGFPHQKLLSYLCSS